MRRVLFIAALFAMLAACTLKTPEGAACDAIGDVSQCPEGQRCGADGTCSLAAMACEEPICTTNSCNGQELTRCVPDVVGVCTHTEVQDCSPQQRCDETSGACECLASCGDYRICGQDAEVPGQSCVCKGNGGCTSAGTMCAAAGAGTITCEHHDGCYHALEPVGCTDPGMTCKGTLPGAACQCPDAGPLVDDGCTEGAEATCSASGQVLTCQRMVAGSECFVWRVAFACGSGLTCTPGGAGACACPAHPPASRTLFADPTSPTSAFVEPNGADVDYCRFKTLQAAVAGATSGDTVKATGAGPVVLFREPGFTINGGVSVVGDESTSSIPPGVVIELSGGAQLGIVLEAGASLRGVAVRKAAGAGSTTGIEVQGPSPDGRSSLQDVWVTNPEPSNTFTTGVLVSGPGAVRLERLTLLDVVGNGLEVARSAVTDTLSVATLLAKRNTVGVNVKVGDATLAGATIEASAAQGVLVSNASVGRVGLGLADSSIRFNGGGGIAANRLTRFHMERTTVCGNTAAMQDVPGFAFQRRLGGLTLGGSAPADQLVEGNLFHDNTGDQVALIGSGAQSWSFSATACGTKSNVFTGYATTQTAGIPDGTGILASGVSVDAVRAGWPQAPAGDQDFLESVGGLVDADGGAFQYCTLAQVTQVATCAVVPATP